jgi:NADPH2:quinone reductase
MRAVVCNAFGPPESLAVEDRPLPEPAAGQVRIRITAAGVDFADMLMVAGRYQVKPPTPFIPGSECCGVVDALGPGAQGWAVGDAVIAASVDGGFFAEYACLPAERLTPWPAGLPAEVAAGFILGHGTAWFGLVQRGGLKAGETVLVTGAGGGVGIAAIEVAKRSGARVIAAAGSPDKLALAKKHGADDLIDYRAENLRDRIKALTGGRGYDVLFDTVGGDMFDEALRAGAAYARLLVIGFASGRIPEPPTNRLLLKNMSVVGVGFGAVVATSPEGTRAVIDGLAALHAVQPFESAASESVGLDRAGEALARLARREVAGKLVVRP